MKSVVRLSIVGDTLVLGYTDDEESSGEVHSISVNWRENLNVKKVLVAAMRIIGTFLLTEKKTLNQVEEEDLEQLFQQLLKEPPGSS